MAALRGAARVPFCDAAEREAMKQHPEPRPGHELYNLVATPPPDPVDNFRDECRNVWAYLRSKRARRGGDLFGLSISSLCVAFDCTGDAECLSVSPIVELLHQFRKGVFEAPAFDFLRDNRAFLVAKDGHTAANPKPRVIQTAASVLRLLCGYLRSLHRDDLADVAVVGPYQCAVGLPPGTSGGLQLLLLTYSVATAPAPASAPASASGGATYPAHRTRSAAALSSAAMPGTPGLPASPPADKPPFIYVSVDVSRCFPSVDAEALYNNAMLFLPAALRCILNLDSRRPPTSHYTQIGRASCRERV
jgi:hypothetical protein